MGKVLSSLVIILLLSGCSGPGTIDTNQDNYLVSIVFHDTIKEVQKHCGDGTAGCTRCNPANSVCLIHSIRERCVLDHEMDHVLYGWFHGERWARSCKERG